MGLFFVFFLKESNSLAETERGSQKPHFVLAAGRGLYPRSSLKEVYSPYNLMYVRRDPLSSDTRYALDKLADSLKKHGFGATQLGLADLTQISQTLSQSKESSTRPIVLLLVAHGNVSDQFYFVDGAGQTINQDMLTATLSFNEISLVLFVCHSHRIQLDSIQGEIFTASDDSFPTVASGNWYRWVEGIIERPDRIWPITELAKSWDETVRGGLRGPMAIYDWLWPSAWSPVGTIYELTSL